MRIVVIGAGEVGYHLGRRLSEEGQDVVIVESNPDRAEYVRERLDVLVVTGNGASLPVLEEAGIRRAELVLAVTSSDEVNVMSCFAADRFEVEFTVARVSNPEYFREGSILSRDQLGIDLMINPERECAWETFQLLHSGAATDLALFAGGRIQLIGVRVKEGAAVAGRSLAELDRRMHTRHYLTAAIVRDGVTRIPTGASRIEAGDQIFVLAPADEMRSIPPLAGYRNTDFRRAIIAGGSDEAVHLARFMEENDVECTILDLDRRRCVELAELLPSALILHGDATDLELLEMEGVEGVDGFVAFTGHDEVNMLSSLLAKTSGARKVVSLINRLQYIPLVNRVGIDAAVSPRLSTVNAILRYVRRGNVQSVTTLKGIDAEALELTVAADARAVGRRLEELEFPEGALMGAIIRGEEVIIPRGPDTVEVGDQVILFALPGTVGKLERLFA